MRWASRSSVSCFAVLKKASQAGAGSPLVVSAVIASVVVAEVDDSEVDDGAASVALVGAVAEVPAVLHPASSRRATARPAPVRMWRDGEALRGRRDGEAVRNR